VAFQSDITQMLSKPSGICRLHHGLFQPQCSRVRIPLGSSNGFYGGVSGMSSLQLRPSIASFLTAI